MKVFQRRTCVSATESELVESVALARVIERKMLVAEATKRKLDSGGPGLPPINNTVRESASGSG